MLIGCVDRVCWQGVLTDLAVRIEYVGPRPEANERIGSLEHAPLHCVVQSSVAYSPSSVLGEGEGCGMVRGRVRVMVWLGGSRVVVMVWSSEGYGMVRGRRWVMVRVT